MKLLSPTEIKDNKAQEQSRDILRIQEIKEALNVSNKEFAKAQTDFNEMLLRNRTAWEIEETQHTDRVREMSAEIYLLEQDRKEALKPSREAIARANALELRAHALEDTLQMKNEELDLMINNLEEKLSDVGSRETDVTTRENKAIVREEGIEVQSGVVKRGIEALSASQEQFNHRMKEEQMVFDARRREILLSETNLTAREDKIKRDVEALRIERVQLDDMRRVLETEYRRLDIPL